MTVTNLRGFSSDQRGAAEFCIIGGGIAGLIVASRLARAKKRVIVLESGDDRFDPAVDELNEVEDLNGRYGRERTGRGRGLGGSSRLWGGRMIPMDDFGERPHVSQPEWPIDLSSLDRYTREIEDLFATGHDSYEDIGPHEPAVMPSDNQHFRPRWAKCPTFRRCNLSVSLGAELRSSPNVTVWLNATVCGFDVDRDTGGLRSVTARNLDQRSVTVTADQFIIAGGTIESTRLLLLIDEATEKQAFQACAVLGRFFQDHLKAQVAVVDRRDASATNRRFAYRFVNSTRRDMHLEVSGPAQRADKVSSAFVYVAMDLRGGPLSELKLLAHSVQRRRVQVRDLRRFSRNLGFIGQAAYWRLASHQLYVPRDIDFRLMVCVEQLPDWNNRILLSRVPDVMGVRKALLDWKPTIADERAFRSTIAHLGEYWRATGLDNECPLIWSPAVQDEGRQIIDTAEACAHPSGSTRMGRDPATSVVGPDLRCHAMPNVAVASASVFPTAGSANPTFTIMQLAMWLADSYSSGPAIQASAPALAA